MPLFQASTAVLMRSELLLDITQRKLVVIYRRFGKKTIGPTFNGRAVQFDP